MSAWQAVIVALGGQAALLLLLGWLVRSLGSQLLTRDIERFKSGLSRDVEKFKSELDAANSNSLESARHELQLMHTAYELRLDVFLDYYAGFYAHYRRCQRAASADAFERPDGSIVDTKEEFLSSLDAYVAQSAAIEGRIRLLLPTDLLEMHDKSVALFNNFRHAIRDFGSNSDGSEKVRAFQDISEFKKPFEHGFREFLRSTP